MENIKKTSELTENILKEAGAGKYAFTLAESENREFNSANGEFTLFRTTFDSTISIKVINDGRLGTSAGNDLTEEGIRATVEAAMVAAESAEPDDANDIAPFQGNEILERGVLEPDMDTFFDRCRELLADVADEFPKINIMEGVYSYNSSHEIYVNSNGTTVDDTKGEYNANIEFVAIDGEKTTGLDWGAVTVDNLDRPFIEQGSFRATLERTQNSLNLIENEGKFTGTMVCTPECFTNFVMMVKGNYVGDSVILDGTSQWIDKVGQKVASEKLTISVDPYDEKIVGGERRSADGFKTEAYTLIDKGVLQQFTLGLYASKKTGNPVTKSSSTALIVDAGDVTFDEMIASIDRGILISSFSGGQPGKNGEFSGVAKGGFLIENGKFAGPVSETMINGNLTDMFLNIRSLTSERLCNGSMVIPYVAVDGIVISGK